MDFRFQAVFMAVLSTNLVIFITYILMHNQKILFKFGFQILYVFLVLTGIRMLLPFEFTFISHNINLSPSVSRFITAFLHERFFDETVSWWEISKLIWLTGSAVHLYRYLKVKNRFEQYIDKCGKAPSETSKYTEEFKKICQQNSQSISVKLLFLPGIHVPMVCGIRKPKILIPEKLHFSEKDLSFVLRHEMSHFIHHDLYLKLVVQLLCIIFWWNPAVFLLKKQIDLLLEMRVDSKIINSQEEKSNYIQCLLQVAKNSINTHMPDSTISFCSKNSTLKSRCQMLLNKNAAKQSTVLKNLFLSNILLLYVFSFIFILEPDYANPETLAGCTIPTLENSYMTENENGTYNFYLNDNFICVTKSTRYYPDGTSIYRNNEEAIIHKK